MKRITGIIISLILLASLCFAGTNFPTSKETFPDAVDGVTDVTAANHNDIQDTAEALQDKVGIDGSAVVTSLDYKVSALDTKTADVDKTELDILDGATLSTAELNNLDGYTGTTEMLNFLTATGLALSDMTKLAEITVSSDDINSATDGLSGVFIDVLVLSASGTRVVTTGFRPKVVFFFETSDQFISVGADDGTSKASINFATYGGSELIGAALDTSSYSAGTTYRGRITALSDTGFTITTDSSTGSYTAKLACIALR